MVQTHDKSKRIVDILGGVINAHLHRHVLNHSLTVFILSTIMPMEVGAYSTAHGCANLGAVGLGGVGALEGEECVELEACARDFEPQECYLGP